MIIQEIESLIILTEEAEEAGEKTNMLVNLYGTLKGSVIAGWDKVTSSVSSIISAISSKIDSAINRLKGNPLEFSPEERQLSKDIIKAWSDNEDSQDLLFIGTQYKSADYQSFIIRYVEILSRTPEKLSSQAHIFFERFGNNPIVSKVFSVSNDNPYVFAGLLMAIPIAATGALVGGGLYAKHLLTKKPKPSDIDSAKAAFDNAKSAAEKKKAASNLIKVGATAIVASKVEAASKAKKR